MLRRRTTLGLAVLAATLTACDEPSPASPDGLALLSSLDVRAPLITRADLVTTTYTRHPAPDGGPAATQTPSAGVDGPAGITTDWSDVPLPQIYEARTEVGFFDGAPFSMGIHDYTSNKASVETTAHVTFNSQHLASKTGQAEDYTPFLINFVNFRKTISASALVYSDKTCGLSVQGESTHKAWWQFFLAGPTPTWGTAARTTFARPVSQGGCAATATRTASMDEGDGVVCYYVLTYELATGKIVAADLLYCTSPNGELA